MMKTECLSVPLTPVTLIAYLPRGVKVAVAIVSLVEPSVCPDASVTLVLLKVDVTWKATELLAERFIVPLKLFKLVRVSDTLCLVPCRRERLVTFPLTVKSGGPLVCTVIVKLSLMALFAGELSTISRLGLYVPGVV